MSSVSLEDEGDEAEPRFLGILKPLLAAVAAAAEGEEEEEEEWGGEAGPAACRSCSWIWLSTRALSNRLTPIRCRVSRVSPLNSSASGRWKIFSGSARPDWSDAGEAGEKERG